MVVLAKSSGDIAFFVMMGILFVIVFVGMYAWAVSKGRKALMDQLEKLNRRPLAVSFRLFPPARLIFHNRKRDMWFTITEDDGRVQFARVRFVFLTCTGIDFFD